MTRDGQHVDSSGASDGLLPRTGVPPGTRAGARLPGRCLLGLVIAVYTVIVVIEALVHSPNANECAHLIAGVSHWQLGRFELYRVNPPLVRAVAALPAVVIGCETDWTLFSVAPGSRSEFSMVPGFIELNGVWSYRYILLGRLACLPFCWLGAWVSFRWADELFGRKSAWLALFLWCFSPALIGHAACITPHGHAAAVGLAADYAFWRWLDRRTWGAAFLAGVLLGLTLLTKSTWIILCLLWPVVALGKLLCTRSPEASCGLLRPGLQFATLALVGLHVFNLGYLYDGTFKRLGDYVFVSRALTGGDEGKRSLPGNRFQGTWLGSIPIPFPEQFVMGIDIQKADFETDRRTYLGGRWYDHGFWYYYLYAMAVKAPIGTLILIAVAIASLVVKPPQRLEWLLPLQFLFLLAIVSAETSWNAHLRYVLPAVPYAIVWTSRSAMLCQWSGAGAGARIWSSVVTGGVAWLVGSSLWHVPHSLSYFNELAGGPAGGHRHLIDSNVDWGQDLFLLRDWLAKHPEAGRRPIGLVYYGQFNPRTIGIDFFLPEDDSAAPRPPGWYAVSATMLHGMDFWQTAPDGRQYWCRRDGFVDFLSRTPVDRVAHSLFIYRIE